MKITSCLSTPRRRDIEFESWRAPATVARIPRINVAPNVHLLTTFSRRVVAALARLLILPSRLFLSHVWQSYAFIGIIWT